MCAVGYAAAEDLHEDMRVHVRLGVVGWQEVWRRRALMEPGGRRARKRVCQDVVHSTQLCAVTVGHICHASGGRRRRGRHAGKGVRFQRRALPYPLRYPARNPRRDGRRSRARDIMTFVYRDR